MFYFSWAAMCLETMFLCNLVIYLFGYNFRIAVWIEFLFYLSVISWSSMRFTEGAYESLDFIHLPLLWRWRLLELCGRMTVLWRSAFDVFVLLSLFHLSLPSLLHYSFLAFSLSFLSPRVSAVFYEGTF